MILPYTLFRAVESFRSREGLLALLFLALAAVTTQLFRFTMTREQARLAERLADVEDLHAIGLLAEIQAWPDARLARGAEAALTRLLPQVNAGHASLLTSTQRELLYRRLRLGEAQRHGEFLVALLRALEQIGDTEAVPYVRALADSSPQTLRERTVRAAANDCLPYLLTCAQHNRDSQVLLRAAACDEGSERLLRPLRAGPDAAPDLLLRSAVEDGG